MKILDDAIQKASAQQAAHVEAELRRHIGHLDDVTIEWRATEPLREIVTCALCRTRQPFEIVIEGLPA